MLISTHVPKTAGATFLNILRKIRAVEVVNFITPLTASYGLLRYPLTTDCIHGHTPFITWASLFPDANYITWVRDPLERCISNYVFDRLGVWLIGLEDSTEYRSRQQEWIMRLRNGDVPLLEYAEQFNNGLKAYLGSWDAIKDCAFVGIQEYFYRCLLHFFDLFNESRFLSGAHWNVVTDPLRSSIYQELSRNDWDTLHQLHSADYEIYNAVLDRWRTNNWRWTL